MIIVTETDDIFAVKMFRVPLIVVDRFLFSDRYAHLISTTSTLVLRTTSCIRSMHVGSSEKHSKNIPIASPRDTQSLDDQPLTYPPAQARNNHSPGQP